MISIFLILSPIILSNFFRPWGWVWVARYPKIHLAGTFPPFLDSFALHPPVTDPQKIPWHC